MKEKIQPYLAKQFVARIFWVVYLIMLLFEIAWMIIVYFVQSPSGSFLEQLPQYFRLLGGNSRFTLPVFMLALIADKIFPDEQALETRRTMFGRFLSGLIIFAMLWGLGALVVIMLAVGLSWH